MAKVWKVQKVEYKTTGTNGVNEIGHVEITVSDTVDGITKTRYEHQRLNPHASGSFTKMEDVTEEQLLTWIKATMGDEKVAYHEKKVDEDIAAEKTPPRGEKVFS